MKKYKKSWHKINNDFLTKSGLHSISSIAHKCSIKCEFVMRKILSGCDKCGIRPNFILDFHHIDQTKKYDFFGCEENIMYLCPNCHTEIHRRILDLKFIGQIYDEKFGRKINREVKEDVKNNKGPSISRTKRR